MPVTAGSASGRRTGSAVDERDPVLARRDHDRVAGEDGAAALRGRRPVRHRGAGEVTPRTARSVTPGSTSSAPDHVRTAGSGRISHAASTSTSRSSASKAWLHSTAAPYMWGWLALTARRPPAARTASIAASSRNGAGSHSRLPSAVCTTSPRWPTPTPGSEPTPIRPGSTSRITEWQPSAASCAIVVQRCPVVGPTGARRHTAGIEQERNRPAGSWRHRQGRSRSQLSSRAGEDTTERAVPAERGRARPRPRRPRRSGGGKVAARAAPVGSPMRSFARRRPARAPPRSRRAPSATESSLQRRRRTSAPASRSAAFHGSGRSAVQVTHDGGAGPARVLVLPASRVAARAGVHSRSRRRRRPCSFCQATDGGPDLLPGSTSRAIGGTRRGAGRRTAVRWDW